MTLAAACSDEPSALPNASNPTSVTSVFSCPANDGPLTFTVRTMGDNLALWLHQEFGRPYLVIEPARAASGARYEKDEVMVWLNGNEAMLEVDDATFKACARDAYASVWEHAKLGGVDFRATGNEPGWILEIRNRTTLLLNYDYGQSVIEAQSQEPVDDVAARLTTYSAVANGQAVTVRISDDKCTDTMSGFEFESTVIVNIGERELHGCGRALH
jgi:uncharacterized membrane protein/membrane-bound inhibitor of C-type lysozyme